MTALKPPDLIEPFVGWKGLLADRSGRLFSPRWRVEWPAGEPLIADCELEAKHLPPHPSCTCGVYAVNSFETLKLNGYNWSDHDEDEQWLIVEVSLWGEVRKGQVGVRASKAYPRRVFAPAYLFAVGDAVRQRYGIPLAFIDRFRGRRIA
jgi:hypothetical protein